MRSVVPTQTATRILADLTVFGPRVESNTNASGNLYSRTESSLWAIVALLPASILLTTVLLISTSGSEVFASTDWLKTTGYFLFVSLFVFFNALIFGLVVVYLYALPAYEWLERYRRPAMWTTLLIGVALAAPVAVFGNSAAVLLVIYFGIWSASAFSIAERRYGLANKLDDRR